MAVPPPCVHALTFAPEDRETVGRKLEQERAV